MTKRDRLARAVTSVVRADNCSGCGGCAVISDRISMVLSPQGHLRPHVTPSTSELEDRSLARRFRRICPGATDSAPHRRANDAVTRTWGNVLETWSAFSSDTSLRFNGASGGVLTGVASWYVQKVTGSRVFAVSSDNEDPSRSTPRTCVTADAIHEVAGSRYQPASSLMGITDYRSDDLVICKPCEASALRRIAREEGKPAPVILSFFCAGTPSQSATEDLLDALDASGATLLRLRFRGQGWPGMASAELADGTSRSMTYGESWGRILNRRLQWRCKVCPDGVGEHADLVVADLWRQQPDGSPSFEEGAGVSAVLVRTDRGAELMQDALAAGALQAEAVPLGDLAAVQRHQATRRYSVAGRLAGRLISGHRVPIFRGYSLMFWAIFRPKHTVAALGGAIKRSLRTHAD